MSPRDRTAMGGARDRFPDTVWEMVSRVRDPARQDYRDGMETLCRRYWKPVYHYLRVAWAKSNEEAKDLVQGFFLWLIEGDALERYSPERASFRRYLKVLLGGFVKDGERVRKCLKRGGDRRRVPLGEEGLPEDILVDPRGEDPAEALDRTWARTLVEQAVEQVREQFREQGHEKRFRVYEEYTASAEGKPPTYGDVAGKLGLKEGDVRNHLFTVREAIRDVIRREMRRLVTSEEQLEEEWNDLFR